ncbi:ribosomal protein L9/RNase H1 [Actinidia rufa]|uniref:Large ribosomal subunit protein bL9c n=1 Tax=Actinidia rufa TaxID=165716 RepID=A0A7J0EDV9_9ERIC|nr:ribosomal protein L9/RNase H1 [Actinidia rufa]
MKDQTLLQSSDRVLHHPLLFAGQGVRYRKLEVILTTTIDKLGKAGETVKVAPGYFRNHLMPKLLAVPNIDKFAYLISEQRKIYQPKEVEEVKVVKKTDEDKMKEYQAAAKRLDGAKLVCNRSLKLLNAIIMWFATFFHSSVLKRFGNVDNELRSLVTKDDLLAEFELYSVGGESSAKKSGLESYMRKYDLVKIRSALVGVVLLLLLVVVFRSKLAAIAVVILNKMVRVEHMALTSLGAFKDNRGGGSGGNCYRLLVGGLGEEDVALLLDNTKGTFRRGVWTVEQAVVPSVVGIVTKLVGERE